MYYFAYGSNMSSKRLIPRVRSAKQICVATLSGYSLRFHKRSNDGSAKCDAFETGIDADVVIGVVFEIDECDSKSLDRCEGYPSHYGKKNVTVIDENGKSVKAVTYIAMKKYIHDGLKPYRWYLEHVVRGAKEYDLPDWYLQKIEKVEFVVDTDETRRNDELSIYNS
jgi:gamma-glutamylcyclotransferase